nr:MAG TPA: hypothetical protein [Caudoviricetes sp.]
MVAYQQPNSCLLFILHIFFSLQSKDQLIRFNDSYPSIKVLINVEKHEHLLISEG